jgi:two-component system cell cycle sensor histidine kinase/response regulator CckA
VLVVDDEHSVLKLAKNILETHDYRVLSARDGQEALAVFALNAKTIRAVIIDLMMPNLSGAATIRELREHDANLPIIAISGLLQEDDAAGNWDMEGIAFVSKPFTVQRLLAAVNDALAGVPPAPYREPLK